MAARRWQQYLQRQPNGYNDQLSLSLSLSRSLSLSLSLSLYLFLW